MAHNIETNGTQSAFASLREPAWHGLGTVFSDPDISTEELLDLAHLGGWDVRLEPVTVEGAVSYATENKAVVRTNPFHGGKDVLGIVGSRYRVLQNEELAAFGSTLGSGARWETAGSIKQGRQVFLAMALERETVLDPSGVSDTVKSYLLLNSSHDGSGSIQASITPVRVVCANTLNFALRSTKQTFKIRHTQSVEGKVAEARHALGLAEKYMDAFDAEAQELFQTPVKDFDRIIQAAYPQPDSDAAKVVLTRWESKRDKIMQRYHSDTTAMIAGTAWGALNALTEQLDWGRVAYSDQVENKYAAASGFDATANAERNRLLAVVKASV